MTRKVNLHIVFLLALGLVVFLIKFTIVYRIKYVGHADASAYAEMADSLIHGRGFQVDYISWYFLKYDPKIVRPEDHWPPLYSIAIAPFFLIFGKTAFAAKLPALIISCFFLPLAVYSLARELSGSRFPGLAAGIGVMLYPTIFRDSLYCLSDVMYTYVISASVLYAVKALDNEKYFYPLGIFMGLAYYAKGSGLVPIPGYILFYIIAWRSIKKVFTNRKFLVSLLIAFLILLPWFIRNYMHFRDPLFSTQRFSAGYIGYEDWESGTYDLYWGDKPPPSYFDKFKEKMLFSVKPEFQDTLDRRDISDGLRQEFRNNGVSLSKKASVSVKKSGKWLIINEDETYTIRKKVELWKSSIKFAQAFPKLEDNLSVYEWGINHVMRMTKEYLKDYTWWVVMDINSGWGKFSKTAFLTYFVNIPALLGLFLLWGNKKRHVIWIISGSLIIFLSAGWEPIYRLALPMIAIMMPLGWAAYFVVLRTILKLIKSVEQRVEGLWRRVWSIELNGNLERKRQEAVAFVGEIASLVKKTISLEIVSGLLVCCLAMPVVILSAENVSSAVKRSGYPYRDGDEEWMDMGVWLRLYAPPDSITMTRNPWELHFYSNQLAVQIPRASLEKTIEVIRYYKPTYIIPQLDIRPSLKPLVEGKVPGLELVYDNKKLQLYKIRYDLLP